MDYIFYICDKKWINWVYFHRINEYNLKNGGRSYIFLYLVYKCENSTNNVIAMIFTEVLIIYKNYKFKVIFGIGGKYEVIFI